MKTPASFLRTAIVAFLLLFSNMLYASTTNFMKIKPKQTAPAFTTQDVYGSSVNLADFKGQKVLLSFYRNVGCPVCNVRFHELQQESAYFQSKGLIVLAVYESSAENMKQYLDNDTVYAKMIPNPDLSIYSLYEVERSMGKLMKGMFHGAMGKMKKGKKLFKKKIEQDGSKDRVGADFLISEDGIIHTAYYGKYVGDHLPVSEIKQFLNR